MFRWAVSLCLLFSTIVCAAGIDMSDTESLEVLLNGGSLTLGGIVFDEFSAFDSGDGSVNPADPSSVAVQANLICGNQLELIFGGFVSSATNGGVYDYVVSYDLISPSGLQDATLNQVAGAVGTSFVITTTTLLFAGGGVGLNVDALVSEDSTALPGPMAVSVAADILLQSFSGTAQMSQLTYTFALADVALTCDGNGDGVCDLADMQILYAANGTDGPLDMDGNGVVNSDDIDDWLLSASSGHPTFTFEAGDVDLNGDVDSTDLGLLLNNFSSTSAPGWGSGDLDLDGLVGSTDLGLLLNNFGFSSASTAVAVPEPSTLSLLFVSVLGLCLGARRRRPYGRR